MHKKFPQSKIIKEISSLALAIIFALTLRTFWAEPFSIPSGSMIPTMLIGDYLYVAKYGYGYSRYSFPFWPNVTRGRFLDTKPNRGDVVVFVGPPAGGTGQATPDTRYIKRLIGLPGEKVQIIKGVLSINDVPVTLERLEDYEEKSSTGRMRKTPRYLETLPNGVAHPILREDTDGFGFGDNTDPYIIPADHYFMLGDNRNHSGDSRFPSMGHIHYDQLIGPAKFSFFSIDSSIMDLWKVWKWNEIIRLDRIIKWIH